MTKNQKIFASIDLLVETEKIPREIVIEGLEEAVNISCRKYYGMENVNTEINPETKRIKITGEREIVDKNVLGEEFDETLHIDINDVDKKTKKIGDKLIYKLKLEPELMDRSTIQIAKQVFKQKLREAKYQKIVAEYQDKIGEIIYGTIEEEKMNNIYFKIGGNIDAVLIPNFQNPKDQFEVGKKIMLVLERIAPQSKKGPKVLVSRNSPKIVEKVLEETIPEIKNGKIKITSIARDAGSRSKIAIELADSENDIDIIGSCVGANGSRINEVKKELMGENIDLIEFFDDEVIYISNALSPALVTAVTILDQDKKMSRVIVPDEQLSLAIGVSGQNVRLASQLTGWKIDIKSETEAQEEGINFEDDII